MESQFAAATPNSPNPMENTQLDLKKLADFARRAKDVDDFITQIRARREEIDIGRSTRQG